MTDVAPMALTRALQVSLRLVQENNVLGFWNIRTIVSASSNTSLSEVRLSTDMDTCIKQLHFALSKLTDNTDAAKLAKALEVENPSIFYQDDIEELVRVLTQIMITSDFTYDSETRPCDFIKHRQELSDTVANSGTELAPWADTFDNSISKAYDTSSLRRSFIQSLSSLNMTIGSEVIRSCLTQLEGVSTTQHFRV